MSSKKYLISVLGKTGYGRISKHIREKIDRLDKLPSTPHPVTLKQINEALK